ncbi:MAG: retroviral-like aspartic protease family protein [Verrucomicrobiota bacterium]
MKRFLAAILLVTALASSFSNAESGGGTLSSFLAAQGLVGAKLERRFGNHLQLPATINNRRAVLMVDTGAPITIIDRNSAGTFGLKVEKTSSTVGGAFGTRWERYGVSMVKSIAMGNCTLTNVPVGLSDESGMNNDVGAAETGTNIRASALRAHLNGLLGSREMRKFGMIIDCTRQMLYVNPSGSSAALSQKLAGFLTGRGFTRVPMRLNPNNHFDVQGALNGHSTHFIVDTGSSTTLVDKRIANLASVGFVPTGLGAETGTGSVERISSGGVKELTIGTFTIAKADVSVANLSGDVLLSKSAESNAGLLGAEYLALNFAIIDVGGMALYLRHPDSR